MWTFYLFTFLSLASSLGSKLNVPRVLLPVSPKVAVNYTLEVYDGGCYTWTSTRPDAVRIVPIYHEDGSCSRSAIVTPSGSLSHKTSAIILAEDKNTGDSLRCDVIVNHIQSLQISMQTHELYIEDAPEEFYARAYDDQGNEFSSLEGLAFKWTVEGHSSSAEAGVGEPVLRWVKYAESSYEGLPATKALEERGSQGHMILLEGLRTGSARVSVKLEDEYFKNVASVDVQVLVVANLVLDPPEVYVLPGGIVPVRLSQFRQGRAEVLTLPSSQYYLEAEDPRVAGVQEGTGTVRGLQLGSTTVRLRDRNLNDTSVDHAPFITVHVVYPNKMGLALLPHRNWATVLGTEHVIQVELFDESGHLVLPGDGVRVKLNIPKTFAPKETSENGTYCQGIPVTVGTFKVKASLRSLVLPDGTEVELKPALKASADLEVFQAITVAPDTRILPWDPITQPKHEQKFVASGGSESYQWMSTNTTVASVSQNGVAKTNAVGMSEIVAFMAKNPQIKGSSKVYVLPAISLNIVQHLVEVEQGQTLMIPIQMKTVVPDLGEKVFTNCEKLPLLVELSDKKNFVDDTSSSTPMLGGCRIVTVKANGVSITKVSVSYSVDDVEMKDSITIASYKTLKPIQPASGETIMTPGSSRLVVFEGGPLPWINKPSGHFRKVSVENETVATVGDLQPTDAKGKKDIHSVEVTCRALGETNVELKVGNIASSSNPNPAVAQAVIKVICAHPAKLYIVPEVRRPDNSRAPCPLDSGTQRIAAQSYLDLNLLVSVKDAKNRKIDVVSSLAFDWSVSNNALASLANQNGVFQDLVEHDGYTSLGRTYQLLKPAGKTGPLDVTAKITGYKKETLDLLGLRQQPNLRQSVTVDLEEEQTEDDLTFTVDLILVDDVSIDPSKSSVFNHPNSKLLLRLHQGSGLFSVEYQPKNVARVQYNSANRTVIVTPLTNGKLQVTVRDLCLWTKNDSFTDIEIVGLARLEVDIVDKVEQGKTISFHVNAYDTTGSLLTPAALSYLQMEPVLGSNIVDVKALENMEHSLRGLEIGETSLAFVAGHAPEQIRSQVVNIQVFAPLRINPRNITLVLGAALQVSSTGGPQPDASVEFSLQNSEIASCSPAGLITGTKLGHSVLVARAVGLDRRTGQRRVYSQDQVDVYIIALHGVRISLPLTRIRQGSEIPLWAVGLDEHQTPLAFGTCDPPLYFDWSLSDEKNARLLSMHHESGLDLKPHRSHFAARLKALQPGHVLVKLKVSASQPRSGQLARNVNELTAEISIYIYDAIGLTSPHDNTGGEILMMSSTNVVLKTNLDSSAALTYETADKDDSALVQISNKGTVSATSSLGQTAVVISAKNNHGITQSLATLVEVRTVSYIMSTTTQLIAESPTQNLHVTPRGFQVELKLSYHDILGRRFHAVRNQLGFRPSRFDLARISLGADNSSLIVKADKAGQTVIHIFDHLTSGLQDYIRIDVDDVITPSSAQLTVGDVVCFNSALVSANLGHSKWVASNNIIDVDAESGIAMALQAGNGEVMRTFAKQATSTSLSVVPVASLRLGKPRDGFITNAKSSVFTLPVILSSEKGSVGSNLVGANCSSEHLSSFLRHKRLPVSCAASFSVDSEVKLEEIFTVYPEFNVRTGQYQCVLKSTGINNPTNSLIDADVVVTVQYSPSLRQSSVIPFHPAVYVHTTELNLSDSKMTTFITVTGKTEYLKSMEISVSDPASLVIGSQQPSSVHTVKIPVQLSESYANGEAVLHVLLNVPQTGQRIQVPVNVKTVKEGVCPAPTTPASVLDTILNAFHVYQEWALTLMSLVGTAAALYIGYRALVGPGYSVTSEERVFLNSSAAAKHDVSHGSPTLYRGTHLWSYDQNASARFTYPPSPNESPSPSRRTYAR